MPYTRIDRIGSGHFGDVYLERDEGLDRLCAAKHVRPPAGDPYSEPQAMATVSHENIVQIYSAEDDPATPGGIVIRMEHHRSGSLADIYKGRSAPTGDVVREIEQACRGLQHLHSKDMLHRDLKPGNLLRADDGVIKLSDFGLSKPANAVGQGPPMGYIAHLPPEALSGPGEIDAVTGDVFALGVTLYRLLEGDQLLDAMRSNAADVEQAILDGTFPPRDFSPHIHDRLRRVIRKATHEDPARRYQTATEMRHALEAARPVVSWIPATPTDGLMEWDGRSDDGRVEFHARLARRADGRWAFWIERRVNGNTPRRQHALGGDDLTRAAAMRHAYSVLGGIAQPD